MVALQAAADLRFRRGAPRPRCAGIVATSMFVSLKPVCRRRLLRRSLLRHSELPGTEEQRGGQGHSSFIDSNEGRYSA